MQNPINLVDPTGMESKNSIDPPGFKAYQGQGGKLSLPSSAVIQTSADGTIIGFEVAGKQFCERFTTKNKFMGYYNGTVRYENPDITIKSGSQIKGLFMVVDFQVTNLQAGGLQVVQTFHGSHRTNAKVGAPYLIDGKYYDAFVDGGWNSITKPPVHPTKPYYYTEKNMKDPLRAAFSLDKGTGLITARDEPTAIVFHQSSYFETSIIATNYLWSGRDIILATYKWGYQSNGASPASQTINLTTPSSIHLGIINRDYPHYAPIQ